MRWSFSVAIVGCLLAIAAGSASCNRSDGAGRQRSSSPERLRLAFTSSSEEEIERRSQAYTRLAEYLGRRLGLEVEVVKGASYSAAIEAMRAGKIDIINSSPLPYMVARAKFGAEPLVTSATPDGQPSSYFSVFITRPASGLRSLDDVKARARELVIAFADPVSTSGHLVPRAHLESMGINPEKDFKQVVFTGNHIASLMSVKSGKLDVAAVTRTFLDRVFKDGRVKREEIVVLWTSSPLHQSVVYTRPGLAPEFRQKLEAAYCDVHRERPEVWAGLRIFNSSGASHYVPVKDSAFDEFRRIARGLEHMTLLD